MIAIDNLFSYCVCTKGLAGAIVFVKSLTLTSTVRIKFTFDLTNLVADATELVVKAGGEDCIVLRPQVLGVVIGVGL